MNEILELAALETWLGEQPPKLAAALATRALLRVLPVGLSDYPVGTGPERANRNTIGQLRAHGVANAALRTQDVHAAQLSLRYAMARGLQIERHRDISDAIRHMLQAVDAALHGLKVTADLAFRAISALTHRAGLLEAVLADRTFRGTDGLDTAALLASPLWPSPRPGWFERALSRTYGIWLEHPEAWQSWNLWYDWRLEGQPNEWGMSPPADEEIRRHLLRADNEFWQHGERLPALVNRAIIGWANAEFKATASSIPSIWPDEISDIEPLNSAVTEQLELLSAQRRNEVDVTAEVLSMLVGVQRPAAMVVALRATLRVLPFAQPALLSSGRSVSPEPWEWIANRAAILASGTVRLGVNPASMSALKLVGKLARSISPEEGDALGPFQSISAALSEPEEETAMELARQAAARAVIEGGEAAKELEEAPRFVDPAHGHISTVADELDRHQLEKIGALAQGQFLEEIRTDIRRLSLGGHEREVLMSPLWNSDDPPWWSRFWQQQRKAIFMLGPSFKVWNDWYDRRLRGKAFSFDFPDDNADAEFYRRLAEAGEDWWARPMLEINVDLAAWVAELRGWTSQSHNQPEQSPDSDEAEESESEGPAEPQSDQGLIFTQTDTGAFAINEHAGASELLETPEACDLHAELRDTLLEAVSRCGGHNQAASLALPLQQLAELMGTHPGGLRIGRFMQRAERCLKLVEAMAIELSDGAALATLPIATRELVVQLEAVRDGYWALVNSDPALAARLRRLRDQWQEAEPAISVAEHRSIVAQSVAEGILTPDAGAILEEMAEDIEDIEDSEGTDSTDERRRRRFVETMRNMPRAAVGWLWSKRKMLLAIGTTATAGASIALTRLNATAHWLLTHADWLRRFFADDPHMLQFVDRLIELAKMLPPS